MSKQEFILSYVLARAGTLGSNMDAMIAAEEGEKAWNYAMRFAPIPFEVKSRVDALCNGGSK